MAPESIVSPRASHDSKPQRLAVRIAVAVAVVIWLVGVVLGTQFLWAYKTTPGATAAAPANWPGSKLVAPASGHSTLVMFVHPLCSCTRASLAELESVLRQSDGRVSAWVMVLHPGGTSDEWQRSSTLDAARHIPGVHVVMDAEGAEADRFGAATSGQVVLYNAQGQLQFSGGITGARGHVGENTGEARVVSFVNTGTADSHEHSVYGCGLHDPNPRTDSSQAGPTT
jgi:hypothetical protein